MEINKRFSCNLISLTLFIIGGWMLYSPLTKNYLTNPDGIAIGLVYKP